MILKDPIAKGNTASIYLHNGKIIKVFNDHLSDSEADYEADKQRYAYSQGLPVPSVLEVTRINGKKAIIMEYVSGKTIGSLIYDDFSKAEHYMNISIELQLKIHEIDADGFELMTDRLSRQIRIVSELSDKQQAFLIERLYKIQFSKKLCHGDYHVFNLILNDNNVTIIDWVDSSAGDIKADVYRSYLLYSQISMDMANMYLRLYCEKSGLSQKDIFVWEPIIAGARLSENVASENSERLVDIVKRYCP